MRGEGDENRMKHNRKLELEKGTRTKADRRREKKEKENGIRKICDKRKVRG